MKLNIQKLQSGGNIGNSINKFIKGDVYNSLPATAFKMIDPTGISSWGDVANAWGDGKFDYNDVLEPLGAIPVFGKLGKLGKFALKGVKGLEEFNAAKKIINASKFVNDDVIKFGGRTFKKSFHAKFTSPYKYREYLDANKTIKGNPLLNYTQYGIKTIGGVDDALDLKNNSLNLLNTLNPKVKQFAKQ